MIKLKIEGDGLEIVDLILALRGHPGASHSAEAAASRTTETTETTETPPAPQPRVYDPEVVQSGMNVFRELVREWAVNFGHDQDPEKQPKRLKLLDEALKRFGALMAFIHTCEGLTRAVRTVAPPTWTKKECRLLAENIASVASATGVGEFADHLEYTAEFTGVL